jgi:hypothetical protein
MLSAAFCNAVSMNCSTIAFQYEKSAFISSIMLIQSVYAFIIDITWFKTSFVTLEVVGALVVVLFNIANVHKKIQNDNKKSKNIEFVEEVEIESPKKHQLELEEQVPEDEDYDELDQTTIVTESIDIDYNEPQVEKI